MEINWFTVIAQILNFFLLVWLLKRFLYQPILKAIAEREGKIVAQLKEAEVTQAEATQEQKDFAQKNLVFDQDQKDRMAKVIAETAAEHQRLMDRARAEAKALSERLATAAQAKRDDEQAALRQHILQEVFAISRKTLTDLASASLEEQVSLTFLRRLQALKGEELEALKAAFTDPNASLLMRSALEIPEKQQQALKSSLDELLNADTDVTFAVDPALIGGIELSTQAYKLAWSISEYLHDFEQHIASPSPEPMALSVA